MGLISKSALIDLIVGWLTHERPPSSIPMSDFERTRYEIKPGDVILIEGRSRVSDVIKTITQSCWSHAALYIGRLHEIEDPTTRQKVKEYFDGQPDVQLIVESELGMGTLVRPLSTYDREHMRICRPRDLTYGDAQKVINYAVGRLGTDYDIRQIFDLLRFLFPWLVMPRKWRSSLFTSHVGTTTKTVCSTMIAEAFASIQYPILPLVKRSEQHEVKIYRRNPKLCTPSDFDYSPYFDIIKYPFMNFAQSQPHYRLLPWDTDNIHSEHKPHR
ncbi:MULTISPECIES: YiiX/YebB-like N1pC/P60 family cysteine hydrolase [unclassified Oleiphilus]|jgi:hypothetical protein|uniref:YiiX/YebB-like N1pC/P60 family cysteine hydrolase n=2 Tax=Oleiphilus TaxID=141450 RepID=UPI0007C2952F|nr:MULTISPECIES: YiiX/YebB-like N1pC/P60 family cysteine hydrolase [unclassified Oleiphilus]KZY43225.1 hypothetical protein A3732_14725 [Oleiphilus sp. HI0050]KZY77022.1 hypothetical protein A3741_10405 [Oleiphilus sp. HI0069]KZY83993.1 hypothetical protein A3740_04890 [Oleiphilus sp. HI0068]KZY89505.1 hypothetical protein A3743_08170 [Oleiphilus sp. HI0072]KZZ12306.1 hypothetical protein A3749_06830 [Oleiphilus sp. HI0078]KZZ22450.1 hypothetical protein A3752_06395 [Oleiphilus sp. HI0081]KZ